MNAYGVRDVERLLRLPRNTIRALVKLKFVTPARGPRNAWRFSFQDLIVLRMAQSLVAAKVSNRRISRALRELRKGLPDSMPLSGLAISAVGDRVVVKEGGARRQAETGQYVLEFEGNPAEGKLSVIDRTEPQHAEDWFARAAALEREDHDEAARAYQRAIVADPGHLDARLNLALLLHEDGKLAEAERAYRDAIKACGRDPLLLFNLAVVLDDQDRKAEALQAYVAVIREDPAFADGHYNLALLYERLGKPRDAIRHMSQYRRLTGDAKG